MASPLTPAQAVRRLITTLKAAGKSERAAQSRVYFKASEDVRFYGLSNPEVRQIARELSAKVKGVWTLEDALACCELLIHENQLESKQAGIEILARYKRRFPPELLKPVRRWLAEDLCNNWATTDALCSMIISPLVQQYPDLIGQLKSWTGDENLWVRRASAVSLTALARRGQQLDDAYEIAEALLDYPEDLIHKATGWLLREAGMTDAKRLEVFLLELGPRLPRTALRYAIEKFPATKRKMILEQTKYVQ